MSSGSYTAVVTGSSGFIATEVVKQLLEKVCQSMFRHLVHLERPCLWLVPRALA